MPIFGSIPGLIIATKYEKRVGGLAPKMNEYLLRIIIVILQMATVFMLFLPFFKSDGIYASGINVIYGLTIGGETIFREASFFSYLIFAPFVSAFINILDIKYNIRNIITYTVSLILSLSVVLIALFADIDASLDNTAFLWLYAIVNVGIMLISEFSIICVRNKKLAGFEQDEEGIYGTDISEEENVVDVEQSQNEDILDETNLYKCSRCGNMVKKGEMCPCREANDTLGKILASGGNEEPGRFCVYCHRKLEDGKECSCVGDGFGITVKTEQSERRKCQYCGQVLVGDSVCVCEKIMKKSVSASPGEIESDSGLYFKQVAKKSEDKISDEIADLERKIEERFSKVKETLLNNDNHEV
ncbi:MAG: hypothetical protein E7394_03920 [Ruminococcaceae bacterium]|nr:hypothetical protein [Oscillospiraceae bacterium]